MIFKQETIQSLFTGVSSSVNSQIIKPFANAEQVIWKYNQAIQHNSLTQKGWERLLAQSDDSMRAYLTSIKGSTASMTGYTTSLQGNVTGFKKVSSAISQYNTLSSQGVVEQKTFATAVSTTNGKLGTYLSGLNGAKASMGGYVKSLITAKAASIGLKVATVALNASFSMGISLLVSKLISSITEYSERISTAAEKAGEALDTAKSNVKELNSLIKEYNDLQLSNEWDNTDIETKKQLQKDINALLDDEADKLDIVNGKYEETTAELYKQKLAKLSEQEKSAYDALEAEKDALWDENKYTNLSFKYGYSNKDGVEYYDDLDVIKKYTEEYDDVLQAWKKTSLSASSSTSAFVGTQDPKNVEELITQYDRLSQLSQEMYDNGDTGAFYDSVNAYLDELEERVKKIHGYESDFDDAQSANNLGKILTDPNNGFGGYIETLEEYQKVVDFINNSDYENKEGILDVLASDFYEFATQVENAGNSVDDFGNKTTIQIADIFAYEDAEKNATALSNYKDQLLEVENAYQTCLSAKEEYDEQGYLSVDTLEKVLSLGDDYLQYLFDEQGNVKLDAEAFKELALARINDMEAQALNNLAQNIKQITDEATATKYLAEEQNKLANSYLDVAVGALWAMSRIDGFADSEALQGAYQSFKAQYEQIRGLFASTRQGLDNTYDGLSDSAKKSAKDAKDAIKDYVKSYMDYMKASLDASKIDYKTYSREVSAFLKKMFDEGKIAAKDYHDYTKEMLEVQKDVYDQVLSAVTRRINTEIDKINDAIDAIQEQNNALNRQKDEYDKILSVIDSVYEDEAKKIEEQKQVLQDKIDALNDEADAYDLIRRKEEALYALEQSQNQRIKKVYSGSERGFIYTADEKAIREAKDNIKDIENEEVISMLEREQEALDKSLEYLEKYRDMWQEISEIYEIEQNKQLAIALFGENYESMILSNRLSDIEDFKNNYISIQEQIDNNESMIESYEEKIKYYENLKEQWDSIADAYQQSMEDCYAAMLLGQNWESDVLSGRLDVLEDFKNQYIAIQKAIIDEAWRSANEQNKANQSIVTGGNPTPDTQPNPAPQGKHEKWYIVKSQTGTPIDSNGYEKQEDAVKKLKELNQKNGGGYSLRKFHTGLDQKYVGDDVQSDSKRLEILQKAGEGKLLSNEVPAILEKGEVVLTRVQQMNIADGLLQRSFMPNINMPNYSYLENIPMRNAQPVTLNIGDIHVHKPIGNVDSLSNAIINELPNKMLQAINRR